MSWLVVFSASADKYPLQEPELQVENSHVSQPVSVPDQKVERRRSILAALDARGLPDPSSRNRAFGFPSSPVKAPIFAPVSPSKAQERDISMHESSEDEEKTAPKLALETLKENVARTRRESIARAARLSLSVAAVPSAAAAAPSNDEDMEVDITEAEVSPVRTEPSPPAESMEPELPQIATEERIEVEQPPPKRVSPRKKAVEPSTPVHQEFQIPIQPEEDEPAARHKRNRSKTPIQGDTAEPQESPRRSTRQRARSKTPVAELESQEPESKPVRRGRSATLEESSASASSKPKSKRGASQDAADPPRGRSTRAKSVEKAEVIPEETEREVPKRPPSRIATATKARVPSTTTRKASGSKTPAIASSSKMAGTTAKVAPATEPVPARGRAIKAPSASVGTKRTREPSQQRAEPGSFRVNRSTRAAPVAPEEEEEGSPRKRRKAVKQEQVETPPVASASTKKAAAIPSTTGSRLPASRVPSGRRIPSSSTKKDHDKENTPDSAGSSKGAAASSSKAKVPTKAVAPEPTAATVRSLRSRK